MPGGGVLPFIQNELFPVQSPKLVTTKTAVSKLWPFPKLPARAKKAMTNKPSAAANLEKKASKSKNVTTLSERILNKGQKVG